MIGDLFSKLSDARKLIDEAKKNLNNMIIEVVSENEEIRVEANANKSLTKIEISESYKNSVSKEELEEVLLYTINKALDEAARLGELEMKKITSDILPNFPGLI